ncbi:MAG: inositol monophosphatase family protein [Pseudomonadota bacterium]|nr:inositol monophosphatase family protein [Pseudomonadota bacterium]
MLAGLIEGVKRVAHQEVMPRYLNVARHRKSDGSLFTQADLAAQEALTEELRALVDCHFLGEEMTEAQQKALWEAGSEGLWCVDPIDGTSNFVNGIPYFAVSVALVRAGRPVLGVVYDPVADECFYAQRGGGAFLNGEPLPIKESVGTLREAIAEVDLKRLPRELAKLLGHAPPYASQRNFGASTLEWCYVAAGRFDVYLHGGQKLWDYAAGSLILEEAGGHYCGLYEDDFWGNDPFRRSVIAALRPDLFADWKTWIRTRLQQQA